MQIPRPRHGQPKPTSSHKYLSVVFYLYHSSSISPAKHFKQKNQKEKFNNFMTSISPIFFQLFNIRYRSYPATLLFHTTTTQTPPPLFPLTIISTLHYVGFNINGLKPIKSNQFQISSAYYNFLMFLNNGNNYSIILKGKKKK